jgi:ABC-type multidrug transport system fused ATPase/permease subunit
MTPPQPTTSNAARVRFLLGERLTPVIVLVLASVLAGLSESAVLTLIAQAASALVGAAHHERIAIGPWHIVASVGDLLAVALGLSILRLLLMAPLSILPARISAHVQQRLRVDLFGAFTRAAWSVQAGEREGHLQEMMTNQVSYSASGAMAATQLVISALTLFVLIVSALLLNVLAAAFVLATVIVLFALLRPLDMMGARRSQALSAVQMEFAHGVGEATRLAEETAVFGVAPAQRSHVNDLVFRNRALTARTILIANLIANLYRGLIYVLVVAGLLILYANHAHNVASLGAVVLLLVRAGGYGQLAQSSLQSVRQALPFVARVQDAAVRYDASSPVPGKRRLREIRALSFDHVDFGYSPGTLVLTDVCFEVSGGESVGIVGPSGTGKSTLSQILLRLREPVAGSYLINGVAASQYAEADWHAQVAYVPQEPRLLHATVADNIRYFRDLDDATIAQAAQLARIHDDITAWADGYETVIGPRADAVSGGQQQRICIARALAGQPSLLILDEPTSALDPHSESLLQESLQALRAELTLFVIAHRMSTLDICDRVMVIENGRLQAFDTAERLRASSTYYRAASLLGSGSVDA